jgi:hypothetical protein
MSGRRRAESRLLALPLLVRYAALTMPWTTLVTGCVAGTAVLAVVARIAESSHWPLGQGAVRFAFVPAIAALAFVPRAWFRPVTQATPIPAWLAPAGRILLAAPVLAITCWAQLAVVTHTITIRTSSPLGQQPGTAAQPPAVYPLIAQLTAWCVVTVAVAACADRSRYADLSGAVAAPVSLGAIAVAWYLPLTSRVLVEPPATAAEATIAWYAVASAALILTCAAMRDQWRRYGRLYSWTAHMFPSRSSKKQ